MKILIVIPARLESTRLPRKMLLSETGKPLIEHTYEAAKASERADHVVVATDDPLILEVVQRFGGHGKMTGSHHLSGTDRVWEVAAEMQEYDLIVNVQGDEPELTGPAIDAALAVFDEHPDAQMTTLATPLRDPSKLESPNCVKVITDQAHRAIYFSRAPIPFPRNQDRDWLAQEPPVYFQHIGLYAYRRDVLMRLSKLPPTVIEKIESLEQLRALHYGIPIHVAYIDHPVQGIDTPEDYQAFVKRFKAR